MSFSASLDRINAGIFNAYSLGNLDAWITKNTKINDKPFSFNGREFQIPIIRDTAKIQLVVKCAQVGLSELSYRWAVAACCVMDNFTVIYTFPTAGDATKNNQTRIAPMIEGSPEVKRLTNSNLNNSEIRQFGRNSFLFFKGTKSETNALSTPADAVIHDELDKSDMDVVTTYSSRLQDKPTKIKKMFSTPTIANYGIDKEARNARRLLHFVRCRCCNHTFLPDYFSHIVIPDWNKSMEEITKNNLHTIRWREAELRCPKCGRNPDLHHTRMPWICENPDEDRVANAWFVSPFSAHERISVPYLVHESTVYSRFSEFKNQVLGITAEEKNEAITNDDIENAQKDVFFADSGVHQMGVDYGLTCHITVGKEDEDGNLVLVHKERVDYRKVTERVAELRLKYRVTVGVHDSQPYTDIVNNLCDQNLNNWGALFVTTKSPVPFTAQEVDDEPQEGKFGFRIVKINRNVVLDEILDLIKKGKLKVAACPENPVFLKHMLNQKRVQKMTNDGNFVHVWTKTGDEEDHYHMALLYLRVATRMREVAGNPGFSSVNMMPIFVSRKPRR